MDSWRAACTFCSGKQVSRGYWGQAPGPSVCPEASEIDAASSFSSWFLILASAEDVSVLGIDAASSLIPDYRAECPDVLWVTGSSHDFRLVPFLSGSQFPLL